MNNAVLSNGEPASRAARRVALLMGATALAGVPIFSAISTASAQVIINSALVFINQNGGSGSDAPPVYDAGGGNGSGGGNAVHINNTNQAGGDNAYGVTANGGRGGHGGYGTILLVGNGGEGGNGGNGGNASATNTADLSTSGGLHHGIVATSVGGRGGDGGGSGALFFSEEGDAGHGGNGGSASATATGSSVVNTTGDNSYGLVVDASGGNGGTGGNAVAAGAANAGEGGNGGSGGSATGLNDGSLTTTGRFSYGMLVRSAGGRGGDGGSTVAFVGDGGNGGSPTQGGNATGTNNGSIDTHGDFASGMVVQSVGGAGGNGGGAFGAFTGGGAGAGGNHGSTATGTNTGNITTRGVAAIGMLVESVGGGGGDGGGAAGIVAIGGRAGGGGNGGQVFANVGGVITTGADGSGDGAHGVLIQSVGGGGGNGGFALAVNPIAAVAIGGGGGTGGNGGTVNVNQAGAGVTVSTTGSSAIGIIAQSVGGGGGNGGGSFALAGIASVAIGGSGSAGGNGGAVNYNIGNANVTTNGTDSTGILAQSVGGGGGNGGFAIAGSIAVAVGVGGSGAAGGFGERVDLTTGGSVTTNQDRSAGIIAQSIGGGGGNGGFAVNGSLGVTVGVGGSGSAGGNGGEVVVNAQQQSIVTRGADSTGLIAQSIGGGGGNGGFTGNLGLAAAVGVGGSGGTASHGANVSATYNGTIETHRERSAGVIAQSVGGGGGNGGGVLGGSLGAAVSIGGSGGAGGNAGQVTFASQNIGVTTNADDSAGIIAQSIGGGGGNGGFTVNALAIASIGVGGKGGTAGDAKVFDGGGNEITAVSVNVGAGQVRTVGDRSSGIIAQTIGGGGGNGGSVVNVGVINIGVGGGGGAAGAGGIVELTNGSRVITEGIQSHGLFAQSVGGGGGSGGFSLAVGGPSLAVGGSGNAGGSSAKVTVRNTGEISTVDNLSVGILAQSIGGGGGDGGFAGAGGLFAAVGVGGAGGGGGNGGEVEVVNSARITTRGDVAHGILAQSVGGGGGNGGSAGAVSVGAFVGVGVAVGGDGGPGRDAMSVDVTHSGNISVDGMGSKGIVAQAIGGGGGNGGKAFSGAFSAGLYASVAVAVSVGGGGGDGGSGGEVTLRADGDITAESDASESGGVVAQSIGGGGGNGGRATSIAGAVTNGVAVNLGVGVGGGGGNGGVGKTVRVETGINGGGSIVTKGFQSVGIMAQSIGGGGGNAGDTFGGAGGYGNNVTVSATVNIGGGGGDGNFAGDVHVTNAMSVTTEGNSSSAIVAQSIGGGGGNGGTSTGGTANVGGGSGVNVAANFAMGGGGTGSYGNTVDVINSGRLATSGDFSSGIIAMSVGGGGGIGGSSTAKSYNIGGTSQTSVSVNMGLGGSGGGASDAMKVTVNNTGGITTTGFGSTGIIAMSVGGGGGAAGAASASDEDVGEGGDNGGTTVSVGVALGLGGGTAGNGGEVSVTNNNFIVTDGALSHGISASSIGGGGGIGGSASAGASAEYAIGGGIGGAGGSSGFGNRVDVFNLANGFIWTKQENSIGVFAQSVGGGGGSGGAGKSTGSDGGTVDVKMSMGGFGAGGGNGGIVNVENSGLIWTEKANSHGIMAQSLGGSGGVGGAAGSTTADADVTIAFGLGGFGGDGGLGNTVTVKNFVNGAIWTQGDNAYGIFAQSIGGGGGAAGGGSTEAGESETVNVNLAIGGVGGAGNGGGSVIVDNFGIIRTEGALSHGVFAQSVGGGGGAAGSASNTSSADMSIGFAIGTAGGGGANGGYVEVNNDGLIETLGDGAVGIMAQSVGGGGGYAGVVSNDASGDDAFALSIGGQGGNGGNGGDVRVTVEGDIITHGLRAHGVVAQSVGGGGGYGGDAKGKTSNALAIGGFGGSGGDGGDVTVIRTGTITTLGKDSIAIIAQSVGGGGGFGGAGFGRFGASEDGGSGLDNNTVGFKSPGGDMGTGGVVTIVQTGEVETHGDRSHGIVAQAVGGGGGVGGTSSLAMGESGAGSQGGIGDANAASATANSQVAVFGKSSYALFGQSATGQGAANAVTLMAQSNLFAQGADSVAAYGESTSNVGFAKGNINMTLNGQYTIGGGETGVAVMLVGGVNNTVNTHSLLYAMGEEFDFAYFGNAPVGPVPLNAILETLLDDFSPMSITGTSGNDRIENTRVAGALGRVIGNVDLGIGLNAFHNGLDSSMVALQSIDLGGGLYTNDGLYTNKGIGIVASVDVTGGFTQTVTGDYVTDLDLNTQTNDHVALSAAGDFAGEAPLNFLSIDRIFGEYLLSQGSSMVESGAGLTPTTVRPTVGFEFLTRVDNGTDLILYADKPTFEDMVNDPNSGVTDPGAVQMAQYLDGLEGVMSPADGPSELARLINMLRFLPDEAALGEAMMRLTPHYAVHTFELISRSTDIVLDSARECMDRPSPYEYGANCAWASIAPESNYERDAGEGTALRDDQLKTLSFGGLREVNDHWSLGAAVGRTDFESEITFNDELLSSLRGDSWQAHALAKYQNGPYFADVSLGGGTGSFEGSRDTTVAQASFIPGETLEGVYLPELLLAGIGNSVTFDQKTAQFGISTRLGYTHQMQNFYLQPSVQFDGRWIQVEGQEKGSVAAFTFDGSSNFYYSVTPSLEIGADLPISDIASLRLYAKGGVELSSFDWEIEGQFSAAEGLGAPPLKLTQEVDSPLYRVGAGMELNGVNGVGLAVRYNGAFGEKVEQQTISGSIKVRF